MKTQKSRILVVSEHNSAQGFKLWKDVEQDFTLSFAPVELGTQIMPADCLTGVDAVVCYISKPAASMLSKKNELSDLCKTCPVLLICENEQSGQAIETDGLNVADIISLSEATPSLLRRALRYAITNCQLTTKTNQSTDEIKNLFGAYTLLADSADDSVFVVDSNFTIEYINDYGARLFHKTPVEMIGASLKSFLKNIKMSPSWDEIASSIASQKTFTVEIHLQAEGEDRWLNTRFSMVKQFPDQKMRLVGIARDMTQQKKTESIVRAERSRAQQYLDLAGTMLLALNAEHKVTLINRKGCELLEADECDIVGKNWFDTFVPPDVRDERRQNYASLLKDGGGFSEHYEGKILTCKGNHRKIAWHDSILRGDDGSITGSFCSGEDITDRLIADKQLRTGREQLFFTIESARGGVWGIQFNLDNPGEITDEMFLTPQMKEFIGYERDEFPNSLSAWLENIHPSDQREVRRALNDHLAGKTPAFESEYRVRHHDGSYRWLYCRGRILRDKDSTPVKWSGMAYDITDRKQAEHDLFLSRQMLRIVLDTIPVSVFWKDTGLNYLGCNVPFANDAGVKSPRDVIGKTDFQLGWKKIAQFYRSDDMAVIQTGQPKLNYEEAQPGVNRPDIWTKTSKIPLRDSTGHITGVLGCYEDITERKRSEREIQRKADDIFLINTLNQANNRGEYLTLVIERLSREMRRIFNCNALAVYLFNEDHTQLELQNPRVLSANVRRTISDMFSFAPPEKINIPLSKKSELWKICHSGKSHLINDEVAICQILCDFAGKKNISRFVRKISSVLSVNSLITVPLVTGKNSIGLLGLSRADAFSEKDLNRIKVIAQHLTAIISRKGVEQVLLVRNHALQSSINAFAIFDLLGKITYVNNAFLKLWKVNDSGKLINHHGYNIWRNVDEGRMAFKQLHELGKWGGEIVSANSDGESFTAIGQLTLVANPDSAPLCYAGSFIDITQRKFAQQEQERLNIELGKTNKELEQIIHVASHDLRTPLVNIQGFSRELDFSLKVLNQVLETEKISKKTTDTLKPIFDDEIPLALNYIHKSVAKMDSLLAGLLQLSRLGRQEVNLQPVDMNAIMKEVISSIEFQILDTGVNLIVEDLPPCVGDPMSIERVFANLIDNAIKYLNPDRPGEIHVSGEQQDDFVVYCFKDNGIGIDQGNHSKIFEIFHQLNPNSSNGEGLGLTIVQRLMEQHNGKIWIHSEPGKGSAFYIAFPHNAKISRVNDNER